MILLYATQRDIDVRPLSHHLCLGVELALVRKSIPLPVSPEVL